jgi:hypothetical protein
MNEVNMAAGTLMEKDRGYEPTGQNCGGSGREDRGLVERTSDEARAWFGDEGAERQRRMDELAEERSYREGRCRQVMRRLGDLRARDVMTRDVITVNSSVPVVRAARQSSQRWWTAYYRVTTKHFMKEGQSWSLRIEWYIVAVGANLDYMVEEPKLPEPGETVWGKLL